MSITIISSRRRLTHKNSYIYPHNKNRKKLAALSQQKKAKLNRDKKREKLDKLKAKRNPKSRKKIKRDQMPYRFKYYEFNNYIKDELS